VRRVATDGRGFPAVVIVVATVQDPMGRRGGAASTTVASSSAARGSRSWRLAPVIVMATAMPRASLSRWRVEPGAAVAWGWPRSSAPRRPPFLPNGALTMHPSAACPIAPAYAGSPTAQARASAPVGTHSRKRSWTVHGGPH
jgi:hypothetical protein